MNENQVCEYWLVQLGRLFYEGGLARIPKNESSFTLKFTKNEEVAFCFPSEDGALRIAEKCGGIIVPRETTIKIFSELREKRERYIESEKEWHKIQDIESDTWKIPFDTHTIFITLDDDIFYQLNSDFSKEEVDKDVVLTKVKMFSDSGQNVMVLHKAQFEHGKSYLLDKEHPERISVQAAVQYQKIGFITKYELFDYIY